MRNILVTDGNQRAALAIARSLGKRKHRIIITEDRIPCLASSSRYCDKGIAVPSPLTQGEYYKDAIGDIVTKEQVDIIIPTTEQSISLLNQVRLHLPLNTILACATAEKMAAVSDKSAIFKKAEILNVAIPKTIHLSNPADLNECLHKIDNYPVVVKPALSKIPVRNGFITAGVKYANTVEELKRHYATTYYLRYPSMIQEKILGHGTGLFTLFNVDKHLALFSHQRLREKPPSGGVSVVSQSVPLDEEMVNAATRLLMEVGWKGVAMIEFKRDKRDGKAKLMEINGRFWGSLQLAIASGVDFPAMLVDLLCNVSSERLPQKYKTDHKLKWFLGTLDHMIIRLKSSSEKINLPACAPTKLQTIMDFFNILETNTSFDVLDPNDLKPFVLEAYFYIMRLLKGRR